MRRRPVVHERHGDAARDVQRQRRVRGRDDGVPARHPCNTAGTDCAICPTGQTSCPTGCKDLTRDVMNCSQCGNACPTPQPAGTGIAVCSSSTCNISCNAGYLECSPASLAMCQQGAWDFEDMTLGGFRITNSPSAAVKLGITGRGPHTGKYTFGIQINATGAAGPGRASTRSGRRCARAGDSSRPST